MSDYLTEVGNTPHGLNGGCPLGEAGNRWNGAYVCYTFTNLGVHLWYVDAYDENTENLLTNPVSPSDAEVTLLDYGTNYTWYANREVVASTTNAWIDLFTTKVYANTFVKLYYVDAMDEYAATTDLTPDDVGAGTNWDYSFAAWDHLSSTNGPDAWTNLYVATGY